jgi:hypothetical protein
LRTDQVRGERRQSRELTICPSVFDCDVLALDVAGFSEACAKRGHKPRLGNGHSSIEEPDHWNRRLLRVRSERPSRASKPRNELSRAGPRIAVPASTISDQRYAMLLRPEAIIDLSLELDSRSFAMRTPAGFKRDMQFAMEVLKEHDAPGGAGQIVRGVHMRLHAGSHVDAPEHNVPGGTQIHELPLETFMGDAIVADLRDKLPGKAISAQDLQAAVGGRVRRGDRLLLRTDHNNTYDGGSEKWMSESRLSSLQALPPRRERPTRPRP